VAASINKEVGDDVKVLPVKLDVSKPEEVKAFVGNLPDEFKDIDILVNNAGLVKGVDKAPEIKAEDIEVMFSTNVTGLINMTQAIMPIMKKRDEGGRGDIINIGSIAGREGYPGKEPQMEKGHSFGSFLHIPLLVLESWMCAAVRNKAKGPIHLTVSALEIPSCFQLPLSDEWPWLTWRNRRQYLLCYKSGCEDFYRFIEERVDRHEDTRHRG
jgi:NAD(P)-dependent dehydrogenase (short-subunit alcohol dehydrogenase family)